MQTQHQNPLIDWFDGDVPFINNKTPGIKYYKQWRRRSDNRRKMKIHSRCHFYEIVAWEWFSREPVLWFLRPWMIFSLMMLLSSSIATVVIWPNVAFNILQVLGIFALAVVVLTAVILGFQLLVYKYEDFVEELDRKFTVFLKYKVWPPLHWFFTKRFLKVLQPWSVVIIVIIAGFLIWKPLATIIVIGQFALLVLVSAVIMAVLVGAAVGLVYLSDKISEWRSQRPSKSNGEIDYSMTEPNRVAQIYEEAHRWYKFKKYFCPIVVIDPSIDEE